jgi:hypothetical protein
MGLRRLIPWRIRHAIWRFKRRAHRAYAHAFGYFWIPCPICGIEFGGHEKQGGRLFARLEDIAALILENPNAEPQPFGTSRGVCKNCGDAAYRLNKLMVAKYLAAVDIIQARKSPTTAQYVREPRWG